MLRVVAELRANSSVRAKTPAERQAFIVDDLVVRGQRGMFTQDLAALSGAETKALMQTDRRNIARFLEHHMFSATKLGLATLRSPLVTTSWDGIRTRPYAFAEQGSSAIDRSSANRCASTAKTKT